MTLQAQEDDRVKICTVSKQDIRILMAQRSSLVLIGYMAGVIATDDQVSQKYQTLVSCSHLVSVSKINLSRFSHKTGLIK